MGVEHPDLFRKAQAATKQSVKLPACLQHIESAQCRDYSLAHPCPFAEAFRDLKILPASGAFDPEKHCVRFMGQHESASAQYQMSLSPLFEALHFSLQPLLYRGNAGDFALKL
ncbi:MAG: hypothetical protein WCH98_17875 [Verrucomicrobiota bacterium]